MREDPSDGLERDRNWGLSNNFRYSGNDSFKTRLFGDAKPRVEHSDCTFLLLRNHRELDSIAEHLPHNFAFEVNFSSNATNGIFTLDERRLCKLCANVRVIEDFPQTGRQQEHGLSPLVKRLVWFRKRRREMMRRVVLEVQFEGAKVAEELASPSQHAPIHLWR